MKKYKIIIVENDEDEQEFMKEGFDKAGLFNILAQLPNGDRLFDWLDAHPGEKPDLILSDLNMPGKNGYDILEMMQSTNKYGRIPVIITSTSSTRITREKCLNLGASEFIVKPDTFIEYVPFVKNLHKVVEEIV